MPAGATDDLVEFLERSVRRRRLFARIEASGGTAQDHLIDCFAVALAALKHPAALAARRYASASCRATPLRDLGNFAADQREVAALCNGVLLRCHDYNDLFIGRQELGSSERHRCRPVRRMPSGVGVGLDFLDALARWIRR